MDSADVAEISAAACPDREVFKQYDSCCGGAVIRFRDVDHTLGPAVRVCVHPQNDPGPVLIGAVHHGNSAYRPVFRQVVSTQSSIIYGVVSLIDPIPGKHARTIRGEGRIVVQKSTIPADAEFDLPDGAGDFQIEVAFAPQRVWHRGPGRRHSTTRRPGLQQLRLFERVDGCPHLATHICRGQRDLLDRVRSWLDQTGGGHLLDEVGPWAQAVKTILARVVRRLAAQGAVVRLPPVKYAVAAIAKQPHNCTGDHGVVVRETVVGNIDDDGAG